MKNNIDLHMHSIYSDGSYPPEELVISARQKGLSAISLTDHDTTDGLKEAREQCKLQNIQFVNGVEINSYYSLNGRRVNIHVLGYAFEEQQIQPYMKKLKQLRYEHNEAIRKELLAIGIALSYEDLGLSSDKNIITRLNFAKALVKKGYARNVQEALIKYLHKGGTAYVEYHNDPFDVVAYKIHEAGGIVSLAHPAEYELDDTDMESLILCLKKEGLEAVECIHPTQSVLYSDKIRAIAETNDLKLTGGSDFHGRGEDEKGLGIGGQGMAIPETFLSALLKKTLL